MYVGLLSHMTTAYNIRIFRLGKSLLSKDFISCSVHFLLLENIFKKNIIFCNNKMPKQHTEYNKFVQKNYHKVKGASSQSKMKAVAMLWNKKK